MLIWPSIAESGNRYQPLDRPILTGRCTDGEQAGRRSKMTERCRWSYSEIACLAANSSKSKVIARVLSGNCGIVWRRERNKAKSLSFSQVRNNNVQSLEETNPIYYQICDSFHRRMLEKLVTEDGVAHHGIPVCRNCEILSKNLYWITSLVRSTEFAMLEAAQKQRF